MLALTRHQNEYFGHIHGVTQIIIERWKNGNSTSNSQCV